MKNAFRPTVMFIAIACAFPALAEQDKNLKAVVITATQSAKDTADAPATVSVVTAKDIENMNVQSLDQALTFLPGAHSLRPGGNEPSVMGTSVVLRGIPDYSRTLVLVDGQTLNDPYIGAPAWETVPAEIVDRVEVVPGPFSSLYGGSAMGGVINIITKAPTKREFSLKGSLGTDNYRSGTFVYQDRLNESLGIVFDYGYKRSDGYVKDQLVLRPCTSSCGTTTPVSGAQRTTDSSGNTAYLVGDKGRIGWSAQNIGLKLHLDLSPESRLVLGAAQSLYSNFDRNHFNTYLRNAAGNPITNSSVVTADGAVLKLRESQFLSGPDGDIKENNRYSAEYNTKLGGGREFKATLGYSEMPLYNNYIVPTFGVATLNGGTATRMLRPSSELSASAQGTLPVGDSQLLVLGASAVKRRISTVTYNITDWRNGGSTGPVQNQTAGKDMTYALYAQDEIAITDRLMAYVGGRYDMWSTEGYIQQVTAPGAYLSQFGSRSQAYFSPKVSLVYRPVDATTIRGSIGSAFHAPNLRDTFGWWTPPTVNGIAYTYIPNPDLKPETVKSWEIGIEQQLRGGTLLRATYFDNRLKNLIYRPQDDVAHTQTVANAGAARIKGIELEARQKMFDGLTAFANLTFNDPKVTENPSMPQLVGKYIATNSGGIPGSPRKMANLGVDGSLGPWSGSLVGHYVGKVFSNNDNSDTVSGVYGSYDAYFIANAKVAYKVNAQATLSLSVNNLTDRKYYQSFLAQGRAYYAELALKF